MKASKYRVGDLKTKMRAIATALTAHIAMKQAGLRSYVPGDPNLETLITAAREFAMKDRENEDLLEMLKRCESLYKMATREAA
jgi:hypothetical protein